MQIKAVTFDVGGTLIEPWPSVGHVYADVATRHGIRNVSAELLQARFKAAWRERNSGTDTRAGWAELVDHAFHGLTAVPPSQTFFPELYERFAQPEAWRVFADVRPTLDALAARGVRRAVISNWDERLRHLLGRLQLTDCFETIVISCEVGCAKPAAGIFNSAASRLNLPPAAILHVGDSLEMDVQGARSAGFHGLQIQRGPGQVPGAAIGSLLELPTIIAAPQAKTDKPA